MEQKAKSFVLCIGLIFCIISLWITNPFINIALIIILISKLLDLTNKDDKNSRERISIVLIFIVIISLFASLISKFPTQQPTGSFLPNNKPPMAESLYLLGVEGYVDGKSQRIDREYTLPAGDRYIYNYKEIEQTNFKYTFKFEANLLIDNITIEISTRDKINVGEIKKHISFDFERTRTSSILFQGFEIDTSIIEGEFQFNFPTNEPHQIIIFNLTARLNYTFYMMEQYIEDAELLEEEFIVPDWYAEFESTTFPRYPYYQPSVDNWLNIESVPDDDYQTWGITSADSGVSIFSITDHPYPHLVIMASIFLACFLMIWVLTLIMGGVRNLIKILFLFVLISVIVLFIQIMVWESDPMYLAIYDAFNTFSSLSVWPTLLVVLNIIGILIQIFHWVTTLGLALFICFVMTKISAVMAGNKDFS